MVNVEHIDKVVDYYADGESTTIEIGDIPRFDQEQYDLADDRDFAKFIKDLEGVCRKSFEYRWLIQYLKTYAGMDECSVLEGVSSRDNSGVKVEVHHSPLTLYDTCIAVVRKRIKNNEDMDIFACAEEVMYNHYLKHVGLIPLSSTVHQMVHNSFFFIPTDKVFGDYKCFKEDYYDYIDGEVLDAIDNAEDVTANGNYNDQMQLFNDHKIYIQQRGGDQVAALQAVKPAISDRVAEIKQGVLNTPMQQQKPQRRQLCYIVDNSKPRT